MTRSGFIALAGRPNAGKSTLVNRLVGEKVAIVSDKPQTTRREVRGIATGDDWQLVLVDLPGVQRPRDRMTERMQRRVEQAHRRRRRGAVHAQRRPRRWGPGTATSPARCAASSHARGHGGEQGRPAQPDRDRRRALMGAADLDVPGESSPSAPARARACEPLLEHLIGLLPEGPFMYPRGGRQRPASTCCWPSSCASRCCAAPARSCPHAVEAEVLEVRRARRRPDRRRGLPVGRERLAEGHPDRQGRAR